LDGPKSLKFAYIPRETLAPWRRRRSTEEEKTMLVKTDNAPPSGELVLTDAEIEVFSQARAAGDNLRKNSVGRPKLPLSISGCIKS
jgi:hypothetical protein